MLEQQAIEEMTKEERDALREQRILCSGFSSAWGRCVLLVHPKHTRHRSLQGGDWAD